MISASQASVMYSSSHDVTSSTATLPGVTSWVGLMGSDPKRLILDGTRLASPEVAHLDDRGQLDPAVVPKGGDRTQRVERTAVDITDERDVHLRAVIA